MSEMRRKTLYERYFKRMLDVVCALTALVVFWWLYVVVAFLVRLFLGKPVLFKQKRPGFEEKLFEILKFRTMTDEYDEDGKLKSDDARLPRFGKFLRATSLDELPEVVNILRGEMSVVGPRPQLVRDLVFMSPEQRKRHDVLPGLTGLAQVNGRNAITWEDKFEYDLKYIEKITFLGDAKIILQTIFKAFVKQEGVSDGVNATAEDFGVYLLNNDKIDLKTYQEKMELSERLLIMD